ncbi:non-ribosomal peptide synthetase [Streptomyces gobiensis]|uniref:non-ribosomal peptide synthetase n=1 Tax=Streptomyces gobiensis TaxID=2875706 RepID=UPI001E625874|nr:non-ribosomal peptide synthetase [Streptomyces gobiensis]UGY93640.1 amino acid adenylation domain-containing protein [Streptomyces gobiensis]
MTANTPHDAGLPAAGLLEILRGRVERDPKGTAFTFPSFDERTGLELPATHLTRGELDSRARAVAATLQAHGAGNGRVLLLLPPGPDFVVGLFGCLYAGACAVACAPPKAGPGTGQGERFVQIGLDAEVAVVVAQRDRAAGLRRAWAGGGAPAAAWIETDSLGGIGGTVGTDGTDGEAASADLWVPPRIDGRDLALMQYTSGSTGAPKGVMVSQDGLLEQLRVFRELAELPDGADVVTWMPVYHALGIAGTVTMSQFTGGRCTLLTPDDFIAEPFRWLKAISDASAPVFSCGPNFAYDRCVERITPEQRAQLDLSRWHSAFNAAERIQRRTIDAFTRTFEPHGFRREAWFPGYGLTEVTLGISGRRGPEPLVLTMDAAALEQGRAEPLGTDSAARSTDRSAELVGCGVPHPRVRMLVVDPGTRTECGQGEVGEIWIAGQVVNQGYWRRPEQTEEAFSGRLANGEGPFLRSGDLAFRHGDEVVVCGRLKELIIIRGRNIHPQDVEAAARRAHPALATAPAAAFSVDAAEGERLVLVQSVESSAEDAGDLDLAALGAEVRAAIAAEQDVEAHAVVFVAPGDIPMTGSGKIRRTTCRQAYLDGELKPLHTAAASAAPAAPPDAAAQATSPLRDMVRGLPAELRGHVLAAEVRRRIAALLGADPHTVPGDRPLIGLGLESLRTVELRYGLTRDFGVALPMAGFLRGSVADVAGSILHGLEGDGPQAAYIAAWPALAADPAARHEPFPLTEIQHAYLVGRGSAYDLGSTSVHLYTEYDCAELDPVRLRRALDALVRRHEMLRAVVSSDGSQRILPETGEVPVIEYDLRGAGTDRLDAHLGELREELSHQVLPLDAWPMFDIRVTWIEGTRARVHAGVDLLIADVASIRLFFLELGDLYADPDAQLPPLEVSFRDYVIAAQSIRGTEAYEKSRAYWLQRTGTLPPNPRLPLVATGLPAGRKPLRGRRHARLDAKSWARVKERAAARGLTPSAVQLAAYATVLGTWCRTGHFTLNVPLFNRHPLHPDIDRIIGDFTSVTLLEVDLRAGGGFSALAERIQRQLWQDMDHRFFSGVEVIREITRERDVPAAAFSAVVFASAREQGRDQEFKQGEVGANWLGETVYAVSQTPQVLLDHQVYEDRGTLTYKWDAVEAMFPPTVLDEMFSAYDRLLHALAEDEAEDGDGDEGAWGPGGVDVLPEPQRRLIEAANDTAGEIPEGLLCTAVAEQALAHPSRTAVIAPDRSIGYGDLYRHACRLARRLRGLGAEPNRLVAVAIGKSVEQIVAVLAVHLSGAAYLPVDPELPPARQDWLLEHSGAALVLTPSPGPDRRWPAGVTGLPVDLESADGDDSPLAPVQQPGDLAYVLYTSGSTGTPKGVAVSHRAALNTIADFTERCALTPEDRVLGLSALGFDLSVADIFAVLGSGGALVLPEPEATADPARWLELMAEHRITLWNSVPALLRMLVEHLGNPAGGDVSGRPAHPGLAALREIWLSGDWIPVDLPGRIRAAAPAARITAAGGATEAAIWSVAHEVTAADAERDSIPYGTAMRNQTMEVLNDRLEPCPVGVTGEICIGGSGLADGYWRDPERTAESFITHPRTGRRLYRTGDLGRWLPEGEIEIIGREDFQVKIRGHRVELGEIEAALLRQDEVRAAAVTVIGGEREGRRLAAVVVPDAPEAREAAAGHEAYREALGDVLTDPLERLAFTARRPGLRTDLEGTVHALPAAAPRTEPVPPRASRRTYGDGLVPLAALARMLEPLRADETDTGPKYRYASAGGLYPVQTYLYAAPGRIDGLDGGTYYYDPRQHRLVAVVPDAQLDTAVHAPDNHGMFRNSAFSVFFTARRAAVEPMYGKRARDFCLLETGLMTQLLDDAAPAYGIGLCQVGVIHATDGLRRALALDEDSEVLHGLLGGALTAGSADSDPAPEPVRLPLGELLRERLAALLPAALVPATFTEVERLPLTPRGKLDRGALRSLAEDAARTGGGEGGIGGDGEAKTGTEAKILAILRAELRHDSITVHDRLLDIGVDSVVMVRLHRAIQTALDHPFPLVTMFEQPTVRHLADHISGAAGGAGAQPAQTPADAASGGVRAQTRRGRARRRRT